MPQFPVSLHNPESGSSGVDAPAGPTPGESPGGPAHSVPCGPCPATVTRSPVLGKRAQESEKGRGWQEEQSRCPPGHSPGHWAGGSSLSLGLSFSLCEMEMGPPPPA